MTQLALSNLEGGYHTFRNPFRPGEAGYEELNTQLRSCEQVAMDILRHGKKVYRIRAGRFFASKSEAVQKLCATLPFQMLHYKHQFGFKRGGLAKAVPALGIVRNTHVQEKYPFMHTRALHCHHVAGTAVAYGIMANLTDEDLTYLLFAGLLHDLGHPPGCHDSDDWLKERGLGDHEHRTIRWIRNIPEVREAIALAGLNLNKLCKVLCEKGVLGQVLSTCDTLAYICLDAYLADLDISPDFAWKVISSVKSVKENGIEATKLVHLQAFLDKRAQLYLELYQTTQSRVSIIALTKLLTLLEVNGDVTARSFERLHDLAFERSMELLFSDSSRKDIFPVHKSLWRLASGRYEGIGDEWEYSRYESEEDVPEDERKDPGVIIVDPVEVRKPKSLRIYFRGTLRTLQSKKFEQAPESLVWHVLRYRRAVSS